MSEVESGSGARGEVWIVWSVWNEGEVDGDLSLKDKAFW